MSSQSMVLKVKVKNVYGNDLIYPANEAAEKLCRMLGKKTVGHFELKIMQELGFTVEQVESVTLSLNKGES